MPPLHRRIGFTKRFVMSRKRIALACAAVVVGVGSVVIPVAANAGEEENGFSAACRVADQATMWWASGEVSLANKGDRPVRDWTAEFDVSQGQVTLDNPWAYELRQTGKHVTIKPIADRADVAAKGNRAVKVGINPMRQGHTQDHRMPRERRVGQRRRHRHEHGRPRRQRLLRQGRHRRPPDVEAAHAAAPRSYATRFSRTASRSRPSRTR